MSTPMQDYSQQPDTASTGTGMSAADHLRAALEHAQAAQVSETDDADSQALAKCVQQLYAILTARQKEQDGLLGSPGLQRALRRS